MKELLQYNSTRNTRIELPDSDKQLITRQQYYDLGKFLSEQLQQEGDGVYILNLRTRKELHGDRTQHHMCLNTIKLDPDFKPVGRIALDRDTTLELIYAELEELRRENKRLRGEQISQRSS